MWLLPDSEEPKTPWRLRDRFIVQRHSIEFKTKPIASLGGISSGFEFNQRLSIPYSSLQIDTNPRSLKINVTMVPYVFEAVVSRCINDAWRTDLIISSFIFSHY